MIKAWILLAALTINGAPVNVRVVDGDTIRIGSTYYRLAGIDAPEVRGARCGNELSLGVKAWNYLERLLDEAPVRLEPLYRRDKYGRELARLWIGNLDVSAHMIRMGYARAYDGRTRRKSWCDARAP
jgi:micrococcal nuclease